MKASLFPVGFLAAFGVAFASREGPVTRVVTLLQELKDRIEGDQTKEQAAFDKYACWCEETTSQKAQSITATRAALQAGGTQILELRGTVATTTSEIKELGLDIKKNEEAQQKATNIRSKENAAYIAEKVELEQAIAALEAATTVLAEATKGMSLRQKAPDAESKAKLVAALAGLHSKLSQLSEKARPKSEQLVSLKKATSGYAPQSMTVQGILQDMYHTFTGNLESSAQDEATAHRNYETLIATYQEELETLQETLMKKEQLKVESEKMLADATQEYSDNEATLKADADFFDVTKEACVGRTDDWAERKALRTEETAGIDKALEILTSDEARTLFSKAIKPGYDKPAALLQISDVVKGSPLDRVGKALQATAKISHSTRVAALAATVRAQAKAGGAGHFDKVIESIDALVVILKEEGKEDQTRVTYCQEMYQNITLAKDELAWKITKNNAEITKLNQHKTEKEDQVNATVTELAEVTKDIDDMTSDRKTENGEFTQAKKDDEDAIALLTEAKDALAAYYANHSTAVDSLLKVRAKAGKKANTTQEPEPEFKLSDKGKRRNESKGIVAILQQIIEDLQDEIKHGVKAEERAQLDFEARLEAAQALERDLTVKKTNLEDAIAQTDLAIEKEDGLRKDNEADMGIQNQTKADIEPNCDWIMGAVEDRRRKRELELDGLRQAKEFLSGYNQV